MMSLPAAGHVSGLPPRRYLPAPCFLLPLHVAGLSTRLPATSERRQSFPRFAGVLT